MQHLTFWLLLCGSLLFSLVSYSQSEYLKLTTDKSNHLMITNEGEGFTIKTNGVDPYVLTTALQTDLNPKLRVLTFEYFAPKYLENFQVFFGPPIAESLSVNSELGVREGWSAHSVVIPEHISNWGKKGNFLRLDFGSAPGYTIRIRNIHFRELNQAEIKKAALAQELKQKEALQVKQLKVHLNKVYSNTLSQVSVEKESVKLKGKSSQSTNLFLAEIKMSEDVYSLADFKNVFPVQIKNGSFEAEIDRFKNEENRVYDRLLSKWVLVSKIGKGYKVVSQAKYADKIACETTFAAEPLRGKKGIGGFSVGRRAIDDVDSLGITSVTVNMWITQMIRSQPASENMPFEYNGKTYYAVKKWVDSMDKTLRFCADKNLIVSSIILIQKAAQVSDKEIGRIFEHPDCDPSGIYSMANLTTDEGVEYYAAAIDFLARRYNREDNKYGRIHHWIAHNEVDAGWVWTNMGEKHPQLFMDTYHKSMRLLHMIPRQYNKYSKAFISLTHFWAWTEDRKFYHSDELLDMLIQYSNKEGDFDWGIAHHPYPQSLLEPKTWNDDKAEFHMKTPIISFKNIEVLDAWVKQPRAMFQGKTKRTVFLSEQGPNSPDYSEQSLQEQAASMAYVWKKMDVLDGIDAFQFHNWFDDRSEGGLRIGLRRFVDDETDPGGKKPVWYVFRDIGTPHEDKATEFAKKIIGIKDWNEVIYKGPIPLK